MHYLLVHPLEIHNSKGEISYIDAGELVELSDIQQRDYLSVKFKYESKSYWSFRDDILMSIHGDHDQPIDASLAFPGFTVYLFNTREITKVLRVKDDKVILEDMSTIPLHSFDYGVVRTPTVELTGDTQYVLRNDVHAYHKSRIIEEHELEKFKRFLDKYDKIAFDSETTGLLQDMYKLEDREEFLVSISVSVDSNSGYYIRASKSDQFKDFIEYLCTKHLIIHNAAFDLGMLNGVYGITPDKFDDTLIMAKLLNENLLTYRLKDLASQVLGRGKQLKLDEFDYLGYLEKGYFDKIEYILAYYAAADTANTYGLYEYIHPKLCTDDSLYEYYRDIELASIVPVSIAISENGLTVDIEALSQLKVEAEQYVEELMATMVEVTAPFIEGINEEYLALQKQVKQQYWNEVYADFATRGIITTPLEAEVTKELIDAIRYDSLPPYASCKKLATYHNRLTSKPTGDSRYTLDLSNKKFMELLVYTSPFGFGLPPQKSKAGNYSLGKPAISEIEKYLHTQVSSGNLRLQQVQVFFEAFKEYTKTRKLLDAFITPTLDGIGSYTDGKLHASYNLLGTVSSRASCSNPNFQQLANNKKFDLRKCFIVEDRSKYSFLQFDYEAQELRVMAALSGDPLLVELIRNNRDLHSETVRRVWPEYAHLTDEEIKKDHKDKRDIAKVVMFSLAYGARAKKIAFVIKRPLPEAEKILTAFKENAYPVLTAWLETAKEQVKKDGGATLVGGYKRHFKPSGNSFQDEAELRSIVNSLIQGTSAFITKVATLRILRNLKDAGINHKLVILIHDSITIQVSDEDVEAAWKIVEDSMYYDLMGVPVIAVGAVNKDMSKTTELDLDTFLGLNDEEE